MSVAGGDAMTACRTAAGDAEQGAHHQADPGDQHAPSLVAVIAGDKDGQDLSFLLLEQAQILDGELPEDPAAFANRLNQLVLRGIAKG